MPAGQSAMTAPLGFTSFCAREPGQCEPGPSSAIVVDLTADKWDQIVHVNLAVNENNKPESDQSHYGQPEYWTLIRDGRGDCEDFALTKRKQLIDAGLPVRALRMAVVVTLSGEEHAVLTVATDRGDYVLDNLTNDILPWDRTGYAWQARQDTSGRQTWVTFNSGTEDIKPVATLTTN
jgi:predicted transglutaminase-like cysteine proteinase